MVVASASLRLGCTHLAQRVSSRDLMKANTLSNLARSLALASLVGAGAFGPSACSSDNCEEATEGDFAIEILLLTTDHCDYGGKVIRKEESGDVEQPLTCEEEDGMCICRGGDDFGDYEVYLVDERTGSVEYAEFSIEANAATCVDRVLTKEFEVIDPGGGDGDGGAGGAGGGAP